MEVNSDDTVERDVTLSIEGWYLKYLLRQDEMKASVRIQETGGDTVTSMKIDGIVWDDRGTEKWCTVPFYNAQTNGYEAVNLAFSDTMDTFVLIRHESETFYAAASDAQKDLPQILERFNVFLD